MLALRMLTATEVIPLPVSAAAPQMPPRPGPPPYRLHRERQRPRLLAPREQRGSVTRSGETFRSEARSTLNVALLQDSAALGIVAARSGIALLGGRRALALVVDAQLDNALAPRAQPHVLGHRG